MGEILIRAAKRKYLDSGKENNLSVAFARLIKNHILTQVIKTEMKDSWSAMRQDFIYTLPVNDLLVHNMETLKQYYAKVSKHKQFNAKILDSERASELFSVKNPEIGLEWKIVRQIFGLSKMT